MSEIADIDNVDPVLYAQSTLNADAVLKELGFLFKGTSDLGRDHWLKSAGHGIWHSVIVDKNEPTVNYRQVRVKGRSVLDKEFQVIRHLDVPVSEVRRVMLKWKTTSHVDEAAEVIQRLLDNDPDALEPRGELDRLLPGRCPECGSSNVSDADDEGLIDCLKCGIWFEPLHPANSPAVPGNYPEPEAYARRHLRYHGDAELQQEAEDFDPDDPQAFLDRLPVLNPRIAITFSQTTPESSEQGDVSDSGWIDEEGVEMTPDAFDREEGLTAVDLAVKYLYDEGAAEASSSHFHPGVWYSTGYHVIDYRTGTDEERCFHLKDFSDAEERAIWDKMHAHWHRQPR